MGWNDHVEFREMWCLNCDAVDTWEFWNEIALARYSGGFDKLLGHDASNHARCPRCGSTKGEPVEY
jgi:hypothetical protein